MLSDESQVIQLSRHPVKLFIWALIAAFFIWLAFRIAVTVVIFALGGLMAYVVSAPISRLSSLKLPGAKGKIPWGLSACIVYLLLAGLLALFLLYSVPIAIEQANTLASSAPGYARQWSAETDRFQAWYQRLQLPPEVKAAADKYGARLVDLIGSEFSDLAKAAAGGILKLFYGILILGASFLFSLYIVIEQKKIKQNILEMFPASWRADTEELFGNIGRVVGGYIRGLVLISVAAGIGSYLVLFLMDAFGLHYRYRLLTAAVIAAFYPIPLAGVLIPRIAAAVLGFLQAGRWAAGLWIFIALSIVGAVVDNIVLPVVMGKGIGISPLMVLFVVCAGGELFGIWGLILSLPAAAVIRLMFFYIQKRVAI